jgi:hypothetical protein
VVARVTNLTGISSGLFSVGDQDSTSPTKINIGLVSLSSAVPPGNFASVQFDCTPGAPAPTAASFACAADISTLQGNPVTGSCSVVSVVTTP